MIDLKILEKLRAWTFRVNGGSGILVRSPAAGRFVLSAAHVVEDRESSSLQNLTGSSECHVIKSYKDVDVCLIEDRPAMKGDGIDLLDPNDKPIPGEDVWVCGYPSGWRGLEGIVSKGVWAGTGEESWIDASANWGNSGGAVCVLRDSELRLAGIVCRAGGQSSEEFGRFTVDLDNGASELLTLARDPRIGTGIVGGLNVKQFAAYMGQTLSTLALYTKQHFRSGFTQVVPSTVIRTTLQWTE